MPYLNPNPEFVHALARKWQREDLEEGDREFAVPGTLIRHSWAAKCSRAIAYSMQEVEGDALDLPAHYTFGIGRALHELWQEAITEAYADVEGYSVEHEVAVHLPACSSSGHIDTVVSGPDEKVAVELKTINGTGYQFAIGMGRGPAQGPRWSAVVQGSVNAYGIDADRLVLPYLPLESISKGKALKANVDELLRCGAEWVLEPEEFRPIAEREIERWQWLTELHKRDQDLPPRWLPDPSLPPRSVVVDPTRGTTLNPEGEGGKTWMCDYCDYQRKCVQDG